MNMISMSHSIHISIVVFDSSLMPMGLKTGGSTEAGDREVEANYLVRLVYGTAQCPLIPTDLISREKQ